MAGFILQDKFLRFDRASANNIRLKAVGGLRAHHNDGSDGKHQQGDNLRWNFLSAWSLQKRPSGVKASVELEALTPRLKVVPSRRTNDKAEEQKEKTETMSFRTSFAF